MLEKLFAGLDAPIRRKANKKNVVKRISNRITLGHFLKYKIGKNSISVTIASRSSAMISYLISFIG